MRAAALVLALLAAPAFAAEPPPAVPLYRSFGRWFAACDNVRSCEARGYDEVTRADLRVLRPAGPAPATLVLTAEDAVDPAAIRLDGAALDVAWTVHPATPDTPATLSVTDPAALAAFVARLRNGHVLTLDAKAGDPPRTIPLDGFTAALLLVDAVQGRPGTSTALVAATGPGAPPPAPPLPATPAWRRPPALTAAESGALASRVATLPSPLFGHCTATEPTRVDALDAARAIAIRPCYLAAYQASALVEVVPRAGGAPVPVRLPLPGVPRVAGDPGAGMAGPDMVEAGFDPATGRLVTAAKGRGLADCGISAAWIWNGDAFRLTFLAYQEPCGGALPGDWPVLFRTAP